MTETDTAVVLVVDDDEDVIETYELWLAGEYDLRTATSGQEALAQLDGAVDIVLLDRLMSGMSGDDVLEEIRARDIDCRVAMATAVEPDEDIANMPFDAYITKALDRESVTATIDRLLARTSYEDVVREQYAVVEKLAILEKQHTDQELDESDEYQQLRQRFDELEDDVSESASSLTRDDLVHSLSHLEEETLGETTTEPTPERRRYELLDGSAPSVEPGTTLLVATSSPAGQQFITRSLRRSLDDGEGVLVITTDNQAASIVETLGDTTTSTDRLRIVDCQSGATGMEGDPIVAQDVDTPRNLTDIGIGFTNVFTEFDEMGIERGRCGLLSLSVILSYVDQETAYRFCQTLARGIREEAFVGLFLLDRNAHDEQTENMLRRAVDGVVEIRRQDGNHEFRVSGLDGVPADWIPFQ